MKSSRPSFWKNLFSSKKNIGICVSILAVIAAAVSVVGYNSLKNGTPLHHNAKASASAKKPNPGNSSKPDSKSPDGTGTPQGPEAQQGPSQTKLGTAVNSRSKETGTVAYFGKRRQNEHIGQPPGPDTQIPGVPKTPVKPRPVKDPYHLVWKDDFNGTSLNTNDWNFEYHDPGWVNNELQQYVDSPSNVFVKNGELVIKAVKTVDQNGKAHYTSARINTKGKHDFKYGKFEIRAKVPSGKGFLPAIWMMPTDENLYGQWPKCGEMDIMEVLGDTINKSYGTLHFGEPHTQSQGSYILKDGDFSNQYHVFSCEWDPGEIRFYVDGHMYHKESDWFTKKTGFDEITYPAPFDQPFYLILNLAVGGDWPGNPDATTKFGDNAELHVDYVKVYQKDSYDENVKKPINTVTLRDPDPTGNYVNNGNFSTAENLSDDIDWKFLLAGNGNASAKIANSAINIATTNAGDLDYSVQLVQAGLPVEQGYKYRLSFDAYADASRTMITDISAPEKGWKRYLNDTNVAMTTAKQNYQYDFDMADDSDADGRLEFNLGNQGSTAEVHISNIRLEKIGKAPIPQKVKSVLPDGNYIYNGGFDEGDGRLGYWSVENQCAGAQIGVTNNNNVRELKAIVPASVAGLDKVVVKQTPVALTGGKRYILSFDAYADRNKTIEAKVAGQTFDSELTTARKTYKFSLNTPDGLNGTELSFLLGTPGTTCIDNVRIQEDSLLINGDFSNGLTGYEVYAYTPGDISYVVDSIHEKDAFCMDIKNTGDQDWKIQLKQNNITLEQGKWYKITLDAKSTLDRKIMYALQRDGTNDNDWTPYSGSQQIDLTKDFKTFTTTFQMTRSTDKSTILSISMGAVGGTQITQEHTVTIDNIKLEEVTQPPIPPTTGNLIKNGDFSQQDQHWTNAVTSPGAATADFSQGKAVYNITNPGEKDWNVQLKQDGLTLEKGCSYKVKFKVMSNASRTVKYALLNPNDSYAWYGGDDLQLTAGTQQQVDKTFTIDKDTANTVLFVISMGKIANTDTPPSIIEISDVSIVKQ